VNDAQITVVGNVAAEPRYIVTRNGTPLLSLRLASTPRRFDRETGLWRDGDTMFMTVTCWRSLAANGQEALAKGDPVVVTGRLRLREYDKDGERRLSAEIEATTVGHDLSRGVARFDRVRRSTGATAEDRQEATQLADIWAGAEPPGGRDGRETAADHAYEVIVDRVDGAGEGDGAGVGVGGAVTENAVREDAADTDAAEEETGGGEAARGRGRGEIRAAA
jgi:single-strand DNA-binding protein